MIGGAVIPCVHGVHTEDLLEWRVYLQRQRRDVPLAVPLHGDAKNLARTKIIHQHCVHFVELGFMILDEGIRTHAALLFAGEENKGDSSLRLPSQHFQCARCFKHRHRPGSVIECALS